MSVSRLISSAFAIALLLGCSGSSTRADDKPEAKGDPKAGDKPAAKADDKADPKAEKSDKDKAEKKETKRFRVTVKDVYDTAPFVLVDAAIWVPEVSILGGESGKENDILIVRKGAAELTVNLDEVDSLTFDKNKLREDQLPVVVTWRDPERKAKNLVLDGTVKSNLQLVGSYVVPAKDGAGEKGKELTLKARLKLREIKTITFEETKEQK